MNEPHRGPWKAAAACLLMGIAAAALAQTPPDLEDLAIAVEADHPREFIYTDKGGAHLAGEAVGADTRSYHGFYVAMHEIVDGWSLRLEDGTQVGPGTARRALVYPDRLVRTHVLADGTTITETVRLYDRQNGFAVTYDGVPAGAFAFVPRLDMRFLWKVEKPAYEVRWQDGVLLACRRDALQRAPDPAHPHWLAVAVRGAADFAPDGRWLDATYAKDQARRAMGNASPYLPGAIEGRIPAAVPAGRVEAVFAADTDPTAAAARAARLRRDGADLAAARRARMQDLLQRSLVRTGAERDDRALAWARLSLDNLIMEQRGPGLYAGFYWFTTYWGRDTFISLPGACIVDGDFATAKTLLRSFAAFQDTSADSPRCGRVPNFVTVDQVQYAGVDGTWWFVRAVDELWRQSGDQEFAREMAPVVLRAVEGALRRAVDDRMFLTHGDGETWMDAGGEANPRSPRGNRAVEVQALWHRGLLTAARLAEAVSADADAAARYAEAARTLAANFQTDFWRDGRLADHLNADGTPDGQVRPNGLLAVLASPALFAREQRAAVTGPAARDLVRPWGVLSLAAEDPDFRPRHLDLARYHYDDAYHNGDVWLWLSGAYVSALEDPRDGFGQTRMLLDEILDEGAVGTLQEIRDGRQAPSNDEFGGATSQAWSLAELLRTVIQDYAGLRADLTADPPTVTLTPRPPHAWPQLSVATRVGEHAALLSIDQNGRCTTLAFATRPPQDWRFELILPQGRAAGELAEQSGAAQADPHFPWVVRWK